MKSHVRDLVTYCECIFTDAFAKCYTDQASMVRDLKTMRSRTTYEGISFLTITLPSFGQDFERCLANEKVTSDAFPGWKRRLSLPAFLQGLTRLVFDARTGGLFNEPDIAAIEGIRQIAYTFKKLQIPCAPERERLVLSGFKEVECDLSNSMHPRDTDLFSEISDLLWSNVFNENYDSHRYIPKHGPGKTAERISGNRKYAQRNWTERLSSFFPSDSYLMSCVSQFDDETDGINCVQFAQEEDELPVRVTCVPKTLKGPRIIAMEPVCMQYAQQALSGYIYSLIERSWLTGGHVNFTDQTINQKLAISASVDGSMATLDLSAASDRVPLSLVTTMLRSRPDFRDAILACRSKAAQMPSGEIIHLKKFASMGSALCFPIESMYFLTVILTALFRKHDLPVTLRNIHRMIRNVYIYGDDIIIPVDQVEAVTETLTQFMCKVNPHKSFWTGKFRESCGMDAFGGYCVTPVYLRRTQPSNRGEANELISWVKSSNQFYKKGYWRTAQHMKMIVESILGRLPIVQENSPCLGWTSFQNGYNYDRWNKKLHRFEVFAWVSSPVYRKDPLEGWSALLKFFLNAERRVHGSCIVEKLQIDEQLDAYLRTIAIDEKHLSRSPRSGTSSIKRRWTTAY